MDTTISMESLEKFEKNFDANRANAMAMNAVAANGVNASAKNYKRAERKTTFDFSISLEQGKITNQKKSGRCWMFAALNCAALCQVMKKLQPREPLSCPRATRCFMTSWKNPTTSWKASSIPWTSRPDGRLIAAPAVLLRSMTADSGICSAAWSANTAWFRRTQCRKATAPQLHRR